jgi:hypothetical protein
MFNSENHSHKLVTLIVGIPWKAPGSGKYEVFQILINTYLDIFFSRALLRSVHVLHYEVKNAYFKDHKLLGIL